MTSCLNCKHPISDETACEGWENRTPSCICPCWEYVEGGYDDDNEIELPLTQYALIAYNSKHLVEKSETLYVAESTVREVFGREFDMSEYNDSGSPHSCQFRIDDLLFAVMVTPDPAELWFIPELEGNAGRWVRIHSLAQLGQCLQQIAERPDYFKRRLVEHFPRPLGAK